MGWVLPSDLATFVQQRVSSGAYSSADEVLRAAFSLLEQREKLLAHIDEGIGQVRHGQFVEYGDSDRDKFSSDIAASSSTSIPVHDWQIAELELRKKNLATSPDSFVTWQAGEV